MRNCDFRTLKFDFRNFTTLRGLLPVPLLSSPFSSAQDGFKNQPKIFLELSVTLFLWKPNTCLKGTIARDFLPPIFFMNRPDFTAKNMPKKAEVKLSSCKLDVEDFRKNCDCRIAELLLRNNISLKSGIAMAEVLPSSCRIAVADSKKSCACPPLILTHRQVHTRMVAETPEVDTCNVSKHIHNSAICIADRRIGCGSSD